MTMSGESTLVAYAYLGRRRRDRLTGEDGWDEEYEDLGWDDERGVERGYFKEGKKRRMEEGRKELL
jgi:hypothetical protein